jgi:hypothetical protein
MAQAATQQWTNRIVGHGEIDPAEIVKNPRNFRLHPQAQSDALLGLLQEVGVLQDVIINKNTGLLVDGELRVRLALQQAQSRLPVKYVDLTEDEEKKVLLFFDRLSAMAVIDQAKLDELLHEIEVAEPQLQAALMQFATDQGLLPPNVEFKEYDESAADDVEYLECPSCHHRWPK